MQMTRAPKQELLSSVSSFNFINMERNYNILLRTYGLQQGIYYSHSSYPRNSFSVIFLNARAPCDPGRIRETLLQLWRMYIKLQKGIVPDLDMPKKNPHHGNLSVLMGYGPKFFEIGGLKKRKPLYLNEEWLFQEPKLGGDPILPGVGLKYADDITSNDIGNAHFIFQFIGDTQLATNRPIIETWKLLRKIDMNLSSTPMAMRSFFTGFNRPDGRGWLGFHDGVSNIKSSERLKSIQLDKRNLNPYDYWTASGTYMAFLRMTIDLSVWESISVSDQERIVGREKTTGCPLIRVDNRGTNLFVRGCPVPGTSEIIERGNERFREYRPTHIGRNVPLSNSEKSHIGRMVSVQDQIFRQGYEFLEAVDGYPYFRAGLNFISFQGGTDKIFRIIKHGFDRVNFGGDPVKVIPGTDKLLSVRGAGIFLVPPFSRGEEFPGDTVFGNF
jgi:Dyp-type peroxidase family